MAVIVSSDVDFKQKVQESEKVVVKYFADWCGSCKLFSPKYRRLSEDERFAGITFLDVNAEENPEARKMANVSNLPFFAVFKNGELLETVTTSKEEAFVELLSHLN
ncbi:thioredoxin family protein [Cytophagales bacterium LB-30]|uniref:Thioredoxin family protein n=1 Tax=Shiella aurantiaca TaxID=3058365 RepID=A0ABT8F0T5_9BACT|nr:thioredoxin family protein [Shiella aurantiaca]MDN4164052.1 thioredoxin family protein [Shiella aurantiaca]